MVNLQKGLKNTKGVIRSCKSFNESRQYNGQQKTMPRKTNYGRLTVNQDEPQQWRGELMCSGRTVISLMASRKNNTKTSNDRQNSIHTYTSKLTKTNRSNGGVNSCALEGQQVPKWPAEKNGTRTDNDRQNIIHKPQD